MNDFQKKAYQEDAMEIQDRLCSQGYLPSDIAAVAYYLLEANVQKAEAFENSVSNTQDLIKRAEALLNENL